MLGSFQKSLWKTRSLSSVLRVSSSISRAHLHLATYGNGFLTLPAATAASEAGGRGALAFFSFREEEGST